MDLFDVPTRLGEEDAFPAAAGLAVLLVPGLVRRCRHVGHRGRASRSKVLDLTAAGTSCPTCATVAPELVPAFDDTTALGGRIAAETAPSGRAVPLAAEQGSRELGVVGAGDEDHEHAAVLGRDVA